MRRVFRHVITGLVSILLDAIILRSRLQAGRGRRRRRREGRGREKGAGGRREVSSAPGRAHRASCRCCCRCCCPGTPAQGTARGPSSTCRVTFTGKSRGGEVLTDEVKDTLCSREGFAWAARGLGDGGAARSELQRELPVQEKIPFSVTIKVCVPAQASKVWSPQQAQVWRCCGSSRAVPESQSSAQNRVRHRGSLPACAEPLSAPVQVWRLRAVTCERCLTPAGHGAGLLLGLALALASCQPRV